MTPIHPGRILKRELAARGLSANRLALGLRVPSGRITGILNGKRGITPETAATMTAIMEGVVERGTAKAAALTRYRVAGKTGTAAKAIPGGYSSTDYNVSFVGFVPSRRPALAILVLIDSPRRGRASQ